MIELPTQKVKPTAFNPRVLLLYGDWKVGKTMSLAQLDNNLIIDIDKIRDGQFGSDHVEALKIHANDWKEIYKIGEVIKEQNKPYKYISLDTVTVLVQWADDLGKQMYLHSPMAARKYKDNPDSLESMTILRAKGANGQEFSPGYEWIRLAFTKCINYLSSLSEYLILVANVTDKTMVDKDSKEVSSADLALTGKIKQIVCSRVDAVGYMYRQVIGAKDGRPESQLRVSFYSGTEILSCARCSHLAGQDFEFDWKKIFIEGQK
jgi:hypothetical protein